MLQPLVDVAVIDVVTVIVVAGGAASVVISGVGDVVVVVAPAATGVPAIGSGVDDDAASMLSNAASVSLEEIFMAFRCWRYCWREKLRSAALRGLSRF